MLYKMDEEERSRWSGPFFFMGVWIRRKKKEGESYFAVFFLYK